jgi:hypothetical protein
LKVRAPASTQGLRTPKVKSLGRAGTSATREQRICTNLEIPPLNAPIGTALEVTMAVKKPGRCSATRSWF